MFEKILIANRGEIACRVIATARRLGIATVAVYSQADAGARHVALADEAYAIGPAPARQSYLRGDLILAVAHRSRARAIHPGYGFLSENADFAQACEQAGIVFIGPPADAIRAMGSKSSAKTLMERAGVALVPGYHGQDQSLAVLAAAAERIGYPVLLKASAGGGGKGMRIVRTPRDLPEALEGAASEARASFGDDHMLVEKYLTHPRHIEVQVFADTHGNIVSLFERDCSIQRRHQKLLEESPAPTITPAQRSALGQAAIAAARAVAYVGAGTVEFIHQDDAFFFMEMNTRLQVEHPVTEFVTGQDLVEWQLRVAAGERLPLMQDDLALRGHAIEVRICAEDPQRDFMPATGPIAHLRLPEASAALRVDTGIRQGDSITSNYDSMIAKLIVHGQDRAEAVRRLARALSAVQFVGPRTTLDLLRAVAADADFAAGTFDTGFIGSHPELLATAAPPPWLWAAAALAALPDAAAATDPWAVADGWRLNGAPAADILLRHGEATVPIRIERQAGGQWRVGLPGGAIQARLHRSAGADCEASLEIDGARLPLTIVRRGDVLTLIAHGRNTDVTIMDALAPPDAVEHGDANLVAPTPGRVVRVLVAAGAAVLKGQKLLIVESMKVETTFAAPRDGVVDCVHVRPDEMVPEGARLVTFRQG